MGLLFFSIVTLAQEGKYIKVNNINCKYYTYTSSEDIYSTWSGNCKDGYLDGEGTLHVYDGYTDYIYKGNMIKGQENGKGTSKFEVLVGIAPLTEYTGDFKEGKIHGYGTQTDDYGNEYTGQWQENNMHGQGTYKYQNGDVYDGEFENDYKHGQGTYTWYNGEKFVGEYRYDEVYTGIKTNKKGEVIETYKNGKRQ